MSAFPKRNLDLPMLARPKQKKKNESVGKSCDFLILNALKLNFELKASHDGSFFERFYWKNLRMSVEEENSAIEEENKQLRAEIQYLEAENEEWFKVYEESADFLQEFYYKRKIFIERKYREAQERILELKQAESLIESRILDVEAEAQENETQRFQLLNEKSKLNKFSVTNLQIWILTVLIGLQIFIYY